MTKNNTGSRIENDERFNDLSSSAGPGILKATDAACAASTTDSALAADSSPDSSDNDNS